MRRHRRVRVNGRLVPNSACNIEKLGIGLHGDQMRLSQWQVRWVVDIKFQVLSDRHGNSLKYL